MIAKLHVYGFDLASLKILQDYLANRKQRTKVDSFYRKRYYQVEKLLSVVPQGPIIGPLLFNIFMCEMFLILKPPILEVMWMIIPHLWLEKMQPMLLKPLKILVKIL